MNDQSHAPTPVDAHYSSGTVVAVRAVRLAVAKAKQNGVGIVVVRHQMTF